MYFFWGGGGGVMGVIWEGGIGGGYMGVSHVVLVLAYFIISCSCLDFTRCLMLFTNITLYIYPLTQDVNGAESTHQQKWIPSNVTFRNMMFI